MLCGRAPGSPQGEARTGRAPRNLKASIKVFRRRSRRAGAVSVKRSLGQRCGMKRPTFAAKTTTPSPPARACSVDRWPVRHGAKRARAARHRNWKLWPQRFKAAAADLARCRCRRASANGVGRSAPRVGRADNHAKSASARTPWAVGRFSMGRTARGARGTGLGIYRHEDPKPQPPTWRGCVEVEPRPMAWDEARSALAAKTTTPSLPARACSVSDRPVLHRAKCALAARYGTRRRCILCFKAAAADLAQCR